MIRIRFLRYSGACPSILACSDQVIVRPKRPLNPDQELDGATRIDRDKTLFEGHREDATQYPEFLVNGRWFYNSKLKCSRLSMHRPALAESPSQVLLNSRRIDLGQFHAPNVDRSVRRAA